MEKEAAFYLIEKLIKDIILLAPKEAIENIVNGFIIPSLSAKNYIIRTRGCCLLRALMNEYDEESNLKIDYDSITQTLCGLL